MCGVDNNSFPLHFNECGIPPDAHALHRARDSSLVNVDGQEVSIPVRRELLVSCLKGEISDRELLEKAIDESPEWLEVKEVCEGVAE